MLVVGVGVLTVVVAFIATLSMVFVNYDTDMFLTEDKSRQDPSNGQVSMISRYPVKILNYFGCHSGDLEGKVRILQHHVNRFSYKMKIMRKEMEASLNILRMDIEKSEVIQTCKVYVRFALNCALELKKLYSSLEIQYKRLLLSILFSSCLLFLLLSQKEAYLQATHYSYEVDSYYEDHQDRRNSSDQSGRTSTCTDSEPGTTDLSKSKDINSTNVSGVRTVFNKVFAALDNSSFFSDRPHVMSNFTVTGSPTVQDIYNMLDPLKVSLQDGVKNLTFLGQEYMKLNTQLRNVQEMLRLYESPEDSQMKENSALSVVSNKDAVIAELKEMVHKLSEHAARLENEALLCQCERVKADQQLDKHRDVNRSSRHDYTASASYDINGAQESSMENEVEATNELAVSVKGEYSRNLQAVLKMLLKSANEGKISFQSIQDFLLSDMFGGYLEASRFPGELEADVVFQDFPGMRDLYAGHIEVLRNRGRLT